MHIRPTVIYIRACTHSHTHTDTHTGNRELISPLRTRRSEFDPRSNYMWAFWCTMLH